MAEEKAQDFRFPRELPTHHLARNDATEFGAFYRAYASRVVVYFARRVFDAEVAADLTGETFAVAYERRHQYRGSSAEQEQGWLFKIAHRQLLRYWRKGEVERRALGRLGMEPPDTGVTDIEYIEQEASLIERRRLLETALGRLPSDQRHAITERVLKERTYGSIAADLGVDEPVVRARVSRGLRVLNRRLSHLRSEELA